MILYNYIGESSECVCVWRGRRRGLYPINYRYRDYIQYVCVVDVVSVRIVNYLFLLSKVKGLKDDVIVINFGVVGSPIQFVTTASSAQTLVR